MGNPYLDSKCISSSKNTEVLEKYFIISNSVLEDIVGQNLQGLLDKSKVSCKALLPCPEGFGLRVGSGHA